MARTAGGEPPVRIVLLGGLRVEQGERVVGHFRMQKSAALLGCLAYHLPRPQRRERLLEMLWPDEDLSSARSSLSTALWSLRADLTERGIAADTLIAADRHSIGLDPERVATDVAEFMAALGTAECAPGAAERKEALQRAADLYRGELLEGFFDDWIFPEQTQLAVQFRDRLPELLRLYEQAGELTAARELALRVLRAEPLCEEAVYWLMRLYAAGGQPTAALRHYRELERLLGQELDTVPAPALQQLARDLARTGGAVPRVEAATCPPPEPPRSRVPPPTPAGGAPSERAAQEAASGAVPLESQFYVVRSTDEELRQAVRFGESIILITGPRQCGKTSLLARGLRQAREDGVRVLLTDFQTLPEDALASSQAFLLSLAGGLAEQLELPADPESQWLPTRSPSVNLRRFLRREVFTRVSEPLLWAMDEVDRLFTCPFASEVFGLFRSWHNERALDPASPWTRFTLVMAYATEAHLFISDLNQSPFNVGLRFELADFTGEQVEDLNARYGAPLSSREEVARFAAMVGGHPFLVRRGLQEMVRQRMRIDGLARDVLQGGGIYKDHLRRLLLALRRDGELCAEVRSLLAAGNCATEAGFYRLRSAGVVVGEGPARARFRCELYRWYLDRHLPEETPLPPGAGAPSVPKVAESRSDAANEGPGGA